MKTSPLLMIQNDDMFAGYRFRRTDLLKEALTHPSVNATLPKRFRKDYERLEFLGDAVLGLVIAELLLESFPTDDESALARRHALLVSGKTLAGVAVRLEIGSRMVLSTGEEKSGGRTNQRNLANVMEALLGALYVDGGLDVARTVIREYWKEATLALFEAPKDAKTALQEYSQSKKLGLPVYHIMSGGGPSHDPGFTAIVSVGDEKASGTERSKKLAEQEAAAAWLATYYSQQTFI